MSRYYFVFIDSIKVDAKGKHPWKAEATEGDTAVTAETITNWYKQVYEPTYTAQTAE